MDFILLLGSLIVSAIVGGWGTSVLWNWFIPSTFGIGTISLVQAIGLSLVFSSIKGFNVAEDSESSVGKVVYMVFKQCFMVIFTVGIGLVVRLFL